MFDVLKFYRDYHIPISKSQKHSREGWVNTDCPFCGGKDGHLGVFLSTGAIKCWKCGKHGQISVIKAMLNCSHDIAKEIYEEYDTNVRPLSRLEDSIKGKTHAEVCSWPEGTKQLSERGKAYLLNRGFNPEEIERLWGIRETGHLGDYKFRIIAPIMFNGVMVSYQGRDMTDQSSMKYKACKQVNEVIEHQTIVYGLDEVKGDSCVIVEGLFDVWRLGVGAVCCFGTAFTLSQVNLLVSRFRNIFVLFDNDDNNAIKMANELGVLLSARGVKVEVLDISDTPKDQLVNLEKGIDPGNLKQEAANKIMEELRLIS